MIAWTSPYILTISNDKSHYTISEREAAYLPAIAPISTMISVLISFKLNDIIGRKPTIMLTAIPYIVSSILNVIATDITVFSIARIFVGIGDGLSQVSFPCLWEKYQRQK